MQSLSYIVQNAPWFILLIGALVFFHELGHFLVAKAFDVKILKFSLGFGPKLFGYRRGETEYVVSVLPLGGFVKMVGDMPGGHVDTVDAHRALSSKPLWQRSLVLFAGPAFNFLLAFVIYLVMFTGVQTFQSTKLGIVNHSEPAWNAGIRPGDEIVAINGEPTPTWRELKELVGSHPGDELLVTYKHAGKEQIVTIEPKPRQETNIFQETETRGKIGVSLYYVKPIVAVIDLESPAAIAGIQSGDTITKIAGQPVEAWHELRAALAAIPENTIVQLEVDRPTREPNSEEQVLEAEEIPEASTANTLVFQLHPIAFATDEHSEAPTPPMGLNHDLFSAADTPWGYTGLVSRETTVVKVEEDTPAADIGMQPGDRLLQLEVQRKRENSEKEELIRAVGVAVVDLEALNGVDAQSDFTITFQRGRSIEQRDFRLQRLQDKDEFKNPSHPLCIWRHYRSACPGHVHF